MSQIDDLFASAQEMPPSDRAALAQRILLSLEANDFDADSEAAWAAELEVRLARIEQGNFQARDWREALAQIPQSLSGKPSP
jgi:putative addiction module component (TIGR02574 family)